MNEPQVRCRLIRNVASRAPVRTPAHPGARPDERPDARPAGMTEPLLAPILAEADATGTTLFLHTYRDQAARAFERVCFVRAGSKKVPGRERWLMTREPHDPAQPCPTRTCVLPPGGPTP